MSLSRPALFTLCIFATGCWWSFALLESAALHAPLRVIGALSFLAALSPLRRRRLLRRGRPGRLRRQQPGLRPSRKGRLIGLSVQRRLEPRVLRDLARDERQLDWNCSGQVTLRYPLQIVAGNMVPNAHTANKQLVTNYCNTFTATTCPLGRKTFMTEVGGQESARCGKTAVRGRCAVVGNKCSTQSLSSTVAECL